jgi:hypothetical protein
MPGIAPPTRPQQARAITAGILRTKHALVNYAVALLGVRGYYLDSMGEPGQNDRMIYDDAIFILSPRMYLAYNANTDPGCYRTGIASLRCGEWLYKVGIHGLNKPADRRYEALVQAAPVIVDRDGGTVETGMFGINIHRGSLKSVSSLGCQTIYPPQWSEFIGTVKQELKANGQKDIPYVLITEAERSNYSVAFG